MSNETPQNSIPLQSSQFDYAWKWFSFHADQRLKMFNYMLIVFGIIAAGVVNAWGKVPSGAIALLCFLAVLLAIAFVFLDYRNRNLVWLGEDVLMELERKAIFGDGKTIKGRYDKDVNFGILWRQALEERAWKNTITSAVRLRTVSHNARLGKHRVWLAAIASAIAAAFFAAGVLVLLSSPAPAPTKKETTLQEGCGPQRKGAALSCAPRVYAAAVIGVKGEPPWDPRRASSL